MSKIKKEKLENNPQEGEILPESEIVSNEIDQALDENDLDTNKVSEVKNEDPLAAAESRADENWNNYLRVVAELENVRKRAGRDVEKARRFALERFAESLLEVADSLEMALEITDKASVESLLEGNAATLKQLQSVLEKNGISTIYPEGEPFNPELHEAISMVDSDSAEPNTVVNVVQRGYELNGRLLRAARVVVAKEISQNKD
ncbi:MAG: nucleotide exchange factor GrpE [Pseudomonadota bacterium]|nr:nucleotide exchange factor GrpE [Pseudomonadota bacterium]